MIRRDEVYKMERELYDFVRDLFDAVFKWVFWTKLCKNSVRVILPSPTKKLRVLEEAQHFSCVQSAALRKWGVANVVFHQSFAWMALTELSWFSASLPSQKPIELIATRVGILNLKKWLNGWKPELYDQNFSLAWLQSNILFIRKATNGTSKAEDLTRMPSQYHFEKIKPT